MGSTRWLAAAAATTALALGMAGAGASRAQEAPAVAAPVERFVPAAGGPAMRAARVELRAEAAVVGPEVRLRNVARWSDAEALAMAQTADLVIARFEEGGPTALRIDVAAIKATLERAGVNLGCLDFRGALSCRVTRFVGGGRPEDGPAPAARPHAALEPPARRPGALALPATRPVASTDAGDDDTDDSATIDAPRTIRQAMIDDLSARFGLPPEAFELRLNAADEKLAQLASPAVAFDLQPRRERNLGRITWDLTLRTPDGEKRTAITADVRAWQTVVVATRPLAAHQTIGAHDVAEKRLLLDRVNEDGQPLRLEQVIGQQAARDVPPGTLLSGRMVEAVVQVRVGQLVTVTVEQGRVRVKWVAEARESGAIGQVIRVRKPGTREEFQVKVTGPLEGQLAGRPGSDLASAR